MAVRLSLTTKLHPLCHAYSAPQQAFQTPTLWRCLGKVRSCHGDSNQRSRQWQVIGTGEYDGDKRLILSKFPSGIPAERHDIIFELNKVIYGKSANIGARRGIQSRLETLESLGCSLDDIQSQPDVLMLPENEVIRRVVNLRKSQTDITVHTIKNADVVQRKGTIKKAGKDSEANQMLEICDILKCSRAELAAIEKQTPSLKFEKNAESIIAKLNFFLLNGFTVKDIKENVFILKRNLKKIAELINCIRIIRHGQAKSLDRSSVDLFLESERSLQTSLPKTEESLLLKQRLLAQLFQVDISYMQDLRYANMKVETILKKVVFLIDLGIDKRDILNHFYLLRHSIKKLEKGVTTAKEAGITKMTAITLVSVIQHRYIPPRLGKSRHRPFISALLDTPTSELKTLGQHVAQVFSIDKLVLKTNIEYLLRQGFTKEDIRQCLLVISHDPDLLVMYVESMPDRPEFQPYEEYSRDKGMLLNGVQYLIERDSNFNCKEMISGGKGAREEEEKQDDAGSAKLKNDGAESQYD